MIKSIQISTKEEIFNELDKLKKNNDYVILLENENIVNWFVCKDQKVILISFNSPVSTIKLDDDIDILYQIVKGHNYTKFTYSNDLVELVEDYDNNHNCNSQFLLENLLLT